MQTQFFDILLEMFVWFIIFVIAMSPILLFAWYRRRRGSRSPGLGISRGSDEARTGQDDLPLIHSRVRTMLKIKGKEVEGIGTLEGYGFVNGGQGIVKYLINVKVGKLTFDHLVELVGPKGLSTWFTSQNITSRRQLMETLGLSSPKYDELQMIGNWQGKKPIWRRFAE